jgi:hypothetical protein
MAYTVPPYAAGFTKALIRQVIAIIQRDMQVALNGVTGVTFPAPGGLGTFTEYDRTIVLPENIPQLIVLWERNNIHGEQTEAQEITLQLLIAIGNQDVNVLAEQLEDYIRALSYVLDNAGMNVAADQSDFYQVLSCTLPWVQATPFNTTPLAVGSLIEFRVVGHEPGDTLKKKTGDFLQSAALSVKVVLEEK